MYTEETLTMLREKAKQLRRDVITCVGVGTAGHVGGSCSSADLVAALYFYKMHYSAADPKLESRTQTTLSTCSKKTPVQLRCLSSRLHRCLFPICITIDM